MDEPAIVVVDEVATVVAGAAVVEVVDEDVVEGAAVVVVVLDDVVVGAAVVVVETAEPYSYAPMS